MTETGENAMDQSKT
ncbi:hypothetical protein MPL3365_370019 [Mesorhizobium plurifarium]|uniref:Uncharacterized protein n=1 Tax=Mesorhizobium plurifarium TaxID=69974 RepID=A0A090G9R8_MESPL|nr:hypothetical protein MPL3365_370019 [Mesorhizobium plurifarium]